MKRNIYRTLVSPIFNTGLAIGFAFVVFTSAPNVASAQSRTICGVHDDLVKCLGKTHGERRNAIGLDSAGNMIEMFVSGGGSWTMVLTKPGGPTCVMSAGENWMQETVKVEVEERPP
jgi:hypothetical protein